MTDLERIKSKIERAYAKAIEKDKGLLKLAQKIKDGKANYDDLLKFSQAVSKIQTKAFFDHMILDQLTEEEANFLFSPTIEGGYDQIAQAAYDVQQRLNELAGLGLEPQIAPIDQEMLDGLMQKVSEGPWEETKKYLDDQLECFFQKSVDRHAEANAKLHYKVGMSPKIIRKAAPGCCEWCVKQAGTYLYDPGMSRNVFRRHTRCRCSVLYDPVDGSKQLQDTQSGEWIDKEVRDQYLEWQASKSGMDFGSWVEAQKSEAK